MAKSLFLIVFSPLTGRADVLVEEDVAVVGRAESCKIRLDGMSIEKEHARIVRSGDSFVIEDLQSRSGTKVNGVPITRQELKLGDEIEIGNYLLRVDEGSRQYGLLTGKATRRAEGPSPPGQKEIPAAPPTDNKPPTIQDLSGDDGLPFVSKLVGDWGAEARSARADKTGQPRRPAEEPSAEVAPDRNLVDRIKNVLIGDDESQLIIPQVDLDDEAARQAGQAAPAPQPQQISEADLIGLEPAPGAPVQGLPLPPSFGTGRPPVFGQIAGADPAAPGAGIQPGPAAGDRSGVFGRGQGLPPGFGPLSGLPGGFPGAVGFPGAGQTGRPGPSPQAGRIQALLESAGSPQAGAPGVIDLFSGAQRGPAIPGAGEPLWGREGERSFDLVEFLTVDAKDLQVGGLDTMKRWVTSRQKSFDPKAREFGVPEPRAMTILGLPGTGKRQITKAFAHIWKFRLARLALDRLLAEDPAVWPGALSTSLQQVERQSPLVMLVDEVDRFVRLAGPAQSPAAVMASRLVNSLVQWLKQKTAPVFAVITASELAAVHPDLLRRGAAIDEIFYVDVPIQRERAQIWEIAIGRKGRKPTAYDMGALVQASEGYTGAEIERAVGSALHEAFNESRELTTGDLLRSLAMAPPMTKLLVKELVEMREKAPAMAVLAGIREERPAAVQAQSQGSGGVMRSMKFKVPSKPEGPTR